MSRPKHSTSSPLARSQDFPTHPSRGQRHSHSDPDQDSSAMYYELPSILLPSESSACASSTGPFPSSPGLPETSSSFPTSSAVNAHSGLHHQFHHHQQQQQPTSASRPTSSEWRPSTSGSTTASATRPSGAHPSKQGDVKSGAWSVSFGLPSRPWSSSSSVSTASSSSVASSSSSLSGLTLELSNASVTDSPSMQNGVFQPVPQPGVSAPKKTNSHTKPTPEGHVPRPRNSFMLYRMDVVNRGLIKEETKHQNISKIVGLMWKGLSEAQQAPYRLAAQKEKDEHNRLYPDYIYQPAGAKKKPSRLHQGSKASKKAATLLENSSKKLKMDEAKMAERKRNVEQDLQVMEGYDSPDDEYSSKRPRSSCDRPASPVRPVDSSHHHYASFAHQPELPQPYALSDVRRSYGSEPGRDRSGRGHGITIGFDPQNVESSHPQHHPQQQQQQQQFSSNQDSHHSQPSHLPASSPTPSHQPFVYMPYETYAMPHLPTAHDNTPVQSHYPNRDQAHHTQPTTYHEYDQSNHRYYQQSSQPAYRSLQTWYPSSTYQNSTEHSPLVDGHTPADGRLGGPRHTNDASNRLGANQQFLPTSDPSPITPGFSSALLGAGSGEGKKNMNSWKSLPSVGPSEGDRDGNPGLGFSRTLGSRAAYGRNPGRLSVQASGLSPMSASRPSFSMGPHGETETPRTKTFINSIIARSPVEAENPTTAKPSIVDGSSASHSAEEINKHDVARDKRAMTSALTQQRQHFTSVSAVPSFNEPDRSTDSSSSMPSSSASGPSDVPFDAVHEKNWHVGEQDLFVPQRSADELTGPSASSYNHSQPPGAQPLHFPSTDSTLSPTVTPDPNNYTDHRPASHGVESPFGRGSLNLETRKKGRPTSLQLSSSAGHRPSRPSSEYFYGPPAHSDEVSGAGQQQPTYRPFNPNQDGSIEVRNGPGPRPTRTGEPRSGETTPTQNSYEDAMTVGPGQYEMGQAWMY